MFHLEEKNDENLAYRIRDELEYLDERTSVEVSQLYDNLFATFIEENQAKNVQIQVEANYNGLRLADTFEESDLVAMMKDFRANRKIHAKYALKIIKRASELLASFPNIREFSLNSRFGEKCLVVGDLHGHFEDFALILDKFGMPGKDYFYVFNGDWVDRGDKQIELLLSLLYAFILRPNRVFLNRGNHEDRVQNSQRNYKPCFKIETLRYFGKHGSRVYNKIDELFKYVPFATIVANPAQKTKYFIVHGGINDKLKLSDLNKLDRTQFESICTMGKFKKDSLEQKCYEDFVDMMWSDPTTETKGVDFNMARYIGKVFGSDVTKKFLDENKFTHLIRSHECKTKGHELVHDDKVITVFSASNYNHDNLGAVVIISPKKSQVEFFTYNSENTEESSDATDSPKIIKGDVLGRAIIKLRKRLLTYREKILEDCVKIDKQATGIVKIPELCSILNNYVARIPYEEIKDRLCECDSGENQAFYNTLFDALEIKNKYSRSESVPESISENFKMLSTIFHMIDSDNTGFISPENMKNACEKIFTHLGTRFTEEEILEFIGIMDHDKDGKIDLTEFSNAFLISCTI